MSWYKKLGYYENPFLIRPMKETTKLVGQKKQLQDALYYIESGSIVFVQAPHGCGKTKFLRTVIDQFRGKIIYVDGKTTKKTVNVEELLRKKNGVKGKVFGNKPKDMILIIDNVDQLSKVNTERIKYYYDQGYLQSVVFSAPSLEQANLSPSMINRIGKRVLVLDALTPTQAVDLALDRLDEDINDEEPLITTKQLKQVYAASNNTASEFLLNLHRVFEEMDFDDKSTIEDNHLNILKENLADDEREDITENLAEPSIEADDEDVMRVGEYYRSTETDIFCGNCGAAVELVDKSCPECDAEFENYMEDEDKQTGEAHA